MQNLLKTNTIYNQDLQPVAVISMLDWGLGHTTRCIPIINELIAQGLKVIIAAESDALKILKLEFPNAEFRHLPGYNINYSRNKRLFGLKIVAQLPRIFAKIRFEKKWLKVLLKELNVQVIISDNRPGFYHPSVHSIYITHQLNIKTGNVITNKIATYLHSYFIKKFDECWIPDALNNGLSGDLSHRNLLINAKFIGPLSRFKKDDRPIKTFDVSIILSGPEPQRSIFEAILLKQAQTLNKKILVVRGLPNETKEIKANSESILIKNHLSATALNDAINSSKIIVSRCGYSSVMDYARVAAKAILVPTPGQSEQEYLGNYLSAKKYFMVCTQDAINLGKDLHVAENFYFRAPDLDFTQYKSVISELAASIKKKNFADQKK